MFSILTWSHFRPYESTGSCLIVYTLCILYEQWVFNNNIIQGFILSLSLVNKGFTKNSDWPASVLVEKGKKGSCPQRRFAVSIVSGPPHRNSYVNLFDRPTEAQILKPTKEYNIQMRSSCYYLVGVQWTLNSVNSVQQNFNCINCWHFILPLLGYYSKRSRRFESLNLKITQL